MLAGKHLGFLLEDRWLFRNKHFEVNEGQCLWIEGPNGVGKTTFLKIVAGFVLPEEGALYWQKKALLQQKRYYRRHISYLGERDGLRIGLTAEENLRLQLALSGTQVHSLDWDRFQLTRCAKQRLETLSSGQRKKLALMALVLQNKFLWLLDEPWTALDKKGGLLLDQLLQQHGENGKMAIVASHAVRRWAGDFRHLSLE